MTKDLTELTARVFKAEKSSEGSRGKMDLDMTNTRLVAK